MNKPKKVTWQLKTALTTVAIALFLANSLNVGLALAITLPNFALISQNNSLTTSNTTPATPTLRAEDLRAGALANQNQSPNAPVSTSKSPEGKILKPYLTTPDRVINAIITAYSSTPDQTDDEPFIAASGKHVYDGMIANNGLPFGTKIKIPSLYGNKIFTVEDRMNARYGPAHFDIWMNAPRAKVMDFGVERVAVEIYYPVKEIASK